MTNIYELFKEDIWKPTDYTQAYWHRDTWGISWSEDGDNPDCWEDSYNSDRTREVTEKDGYLLITLDDGCGGNYQAIFDLSKEVKEDE